MKVPVTCSACGWLSYRTYMPDEKYTSRYDQHTGFGACRECGGPMQRRQLYQKKQAQIHAEMAHWDEVMKRGR